MGQAARVRRLADRVHGYVRRRETVADCLAAGAVDEASTELANVVAGADLVVLCTPIAQMADLMRRALPVLRPGGLVTDVGSVKAGLVADLEPLVAKAGGVFIGSHPMAGAEKVGVRHARPELFEGAICVVTPTATAPPAAVARVEELWASVGGRPLRMSPDLHDDLVSRSSHLPHVVASELANYVLSPVHPREQGVLCATGFRDTTRIAAGSPEMWRDISLANRRNLARVLGVFIEDLQEFQLALEKEDVQAVEEFFQQAKSRRDQWADQSPAGPSTSAE